MRCGRRLAAAGAACALALCAHAHAVPKIAHWETVGGAGVYFIAAPQIPMLDIQVMLDAGHSRDGARPGLSVLTHTLLNEGAGDLDADAIADRFEAVGALYSLGVEVDRSTINLRTLTAPADWLEGALATFAAVLGSPRFAPEQLELQRRTMQVSLRKNEENPAFVAQRALQAAVYPGHPYGLPADGTEASLAAIARADVQAFYRRHFAAAGAKIAMVGAIDEAQARAIAERIAAALPAGPAPAALPAPPRIDAPTTVRIAHPSEQAHVLIGQQGVARRDREHFPVYLGNHSLGGSGFSSRLFRKIRTELGLAYNVYSYFLPRRLPGTFELGFETRGDQAERALAEAYRQLDRFAADGPGVEELEQSRRSIVRGFPLRIASNDDLLGYLSVIGYYDLPLDYLDTWVARMEAISHAEVVAAVRKTLKPRRRVTVIVGGQGAP